MGLSEEFESIDVVARAVDRITKRGRFADFELSNGIVLTLKPVPPFLMSAVLNEFKDPEVPTVYMEEKGRDEPNPNDPDYLKAVEEVSKKQDKAIGDLLLSVGTSVKSVPDGYFPPESDEWIKQIEFASEITGANILIDKENPIKRYLYWLRFYAIETQSDFSVINTMAYSLGGIRENEVQEVVDSFRSLPERRADTESALETVSQNGHTANRADRRQRARDRGT